MSISYNYLNSGRPEAHIVDEKSCFIQYLDKIEITSRSKWFIERQTKMTAHMGICIDIKNNSNGTFITIGIATDISKNMSFSVNRAIFKLHDSKWVFQSHESSINDFIEHLEHKPIYALLLFDYLTELYQNSDFQNKLSIKPIYQQAIQFLVDEGLDGLLHDFITKCEKYQEKKTEYQRHAIYQKSIFTAVKQAIETGLPTTFISSSGNESTMQIIVANNLTFFVIFELIFLFIL